jgi:dCMP deaminase
LVTLHTHTTWDNRFLGLAEHVAQWSRDPSTKVGAVLVDNKRRILSIGFNGFPRGVADDERLHDRDTKYEMVVHAEANTLLFAAASVEGATAYVWPLPPCSRCAALLIQAGIARVVSPAPSERWADNCGLAARLFDEAGVRQEFLT